MTKTSHSLTSTLLIWSTSSAGNFAASAISRALASVTPSMASTGILASASGLVAATSSISTPPSTEAMARKVRLVRSSRKET